MLALKGQKFVEEGPEIVLGTILSNTFCDADGMHFVLSFTAKVTPVIKGHCFSQVGIRPFLPPVQFAV